jgi:hypothetical protein
MARLEARIDADNEKFEVLQGAPISQMDIHQTRTMSIQEEMKAKMDVHQEKVEATIHSIRSELEETITHRVEDVPSCVNQKMQGLITFLFPTVVLIENTQKIQNFRNIYGSHD